VLSIFHDYPALINGFFFLNGLAVAACVLLFLGKKKNVVIKMPPIKMTQRVWPYPPMLRMMKQMMRAPMPTLAVAEGVAVEDTMLSTIFSAEKKKKITLLCLQALLMIAYLTTLSLFYKLTYPDATQVAFKSDMQQLAVQFYFLYGFFPWALYVILTLGFAYRYYNERKRISLSRMVRYLIPHKQVGIISIGAHIYFRYITSMGISMTVVLCVIYIAQFLLQRFSIPLIQGLNVQTLCLLSVLMMPLGMAWGQPFLKRLHQKLRLGGLILVLFCFFLFVITVLSALMWVSQSAIRSVPFLETSFTMPQALADARSSQLLCFTFAWWMAFALPFCWCTARLISGLKIKEVIVSLLGLPVILALLSVIPAVQAAFLGWWMQEGLLTLLSIGLTLGFLFFFFQDKRNLFGFCSLTQKRLSYNAFRNFIQNAILVFAFYLLTRFTALYYFMMVMVVMGLIYLLFCVVSFIKHLYFD